MENTARYIFFGTPKFAATILEKLIDARVPPVALVCNPDRPVGRKQIITPPPTKLVIRNQKIENRIKIFQPGTRDELVKLNNQLFQEADFGIVAAYAMIIPKEVIGKPKLGIIGVHPSLLPKFRGPSPIQSAILAGEAETGVSLFLMDEKLDHGLVISRQLLDISNQDDYETLEERLANLASEMLIETLPKFVNKRDQSPAYRQAALPQDESQATYTKKFTTEDAFVSEEDLTAATSGNSSEKATEIAQKIRALNPEPGVWTLQNNKRVKLLEAKLIDSRLQLTKIQQEGKTPSVLS